MIESSKTRSEDRRPKELFAKLFSSLLGFVYDCFDRIVIYGYLSGLSRPEQVVWFLREVSGIPVVIRRRSARRTGDYRALGPPPRCAGMSFASRTRPRCLNSFLLRRSGGASDCAFSSTRASNRLSCCSNLPIAGWKQLLVGPIGANDRFSVNRCSRPVVPCQRVNSNASVANSTLPFSSTAYLGTRTSCCSRV
jgi:hypothetical protein